jgi:hypothetical protein
MLDRDLPRHLREPSFAHAVGEGARRADHSVLRRDVDDPPAHLVDRVLGEHLADSRAAKEIRATQVGRHDRVPVLFLRLDQRLRVRPGKRGVISRARRARPSERAQLRRAPRMPRDPRRRHTRPRRSPGCADDLRGRLSTGDRRSPQVADDHVESLTGEANGDRASDAGGAPVTIALLRFTVANCPFLYFHAVARIAFVAHCLLNQNAKVDGGAADSRWYYARSS